MSLSATVSLELWTVGIRSKLMVTLAILANDFYWLIKPPGYLDVGEFDEWEK